MKKEKTEKTNVMRLLDSLSISYQIHEYDSEKAVSCKEVAAILSQDVEQVFKTLVTIGKAVNIMSLSFLAKAILILRKQLKHPVRNSSR